MRTAMKFLCIVACFILPGCAPKHLAMDSSRMGQSYRGIMESQVIYNLHRAVWLHDLFPSHLILTDGSVGVTDSFNPSLSIPFASQYAVQSTLASLYNITTTTITPATTLTAGTTFNSQMSFKVTPVTNGVALRRLRALYRCATYMITQEEFIEMYRVLPESQENKKTSVAVTETITKDKRNVPFRTVTTRSYTTSEVIKPNPNGKSAEEQKGQVSLDDASSDAAAAKKVDEESLRIFWKYAKFVGIIESKEHPLPIFNDAAADFRVIFVKDMHILQDFIQEVQGTIEAASKSKT